MTYWVFRQQTDDEKVRNLLFRELREGRLRQGWGWRPDFDIRLESFIGNYQAETDCDKPRAQRVLNKLLDMLRVAEGDILVIPKQPSRDCFTITRAAKKDGEVYSFGSPPEGEDDFRHVVHIDPGSVRIYNFHSANVATVIRSRLKGRAYSSPIKAVNKAALRRAIDE